MSELTGFSLYRRKYPKNYNPKDLQYCPISYENNPEINPHRNVFYKKNFDGLLRKLFSFYLISKTEMKEKGKLKKNINVLTTEDKDSLCTRLAITRENIDRLINEVLNENTSVESYYLSSNIAKIRANSLFGALLNEHFHLYDERNATAITMSGQTIVSKLSSDIDSHFQSKEIYGEQACTLPVRILTDTDSVYLSFDEYIENTLHTNKLSNDEFLEWAYTFDKNILTPLIDSIGDDFDKFHDVQNRPIIFKRENIMSSIFVTGKKHYCYLSLDSEGTKYEEPYFGVVGIETKKKNTPEFIKSILGNVLKMILNGDNQEQIRDYMIENKNKFETIPLYDIAVPGKIGDYSKYVKDISYYRENGPIFEKGMPGRHKSALIYNYLVDKLKLSRIMINSGHDMRYIKVKPNVYNCDSVAFVGTWPEEFKSIFTIDYDKMFEDTAMGLLNGWCSSLGWNDMQLVKMYVFGLGVSKRGKKSV